MHNLNLSTLTHKYRHCRFNKLRHDPNGPRIAAETMTSSSSSVEAERPTQHIIGHFGDEFYRPDDQTNSVKALKERSWSSRSGLNPTRTTTPCCNNTTLGNGLCAPHKGPNVTNPISWTSKNCSYKYAADCEHCVTQSNTEQF